MNVVTTDGMKVGFELIRFDGKALGLIVVCEDGVADTCAGSAVGKGLRMKVG